MITEENLAQMHNVAVEQIEITTKELKEMGFTSNDLTKMVRTGQLIRIKTGYYEVPVKELHAYGKDLIKKKDMEKAVKCFKTCYELEPNNINVLLQLFYQSIIGEEYEDALKYFDGIFNSNDTNDNNIADNYLYLYLLGYITDIPDKYKTLLDSISEEDIMLTKKSLMYPDVDEINRCRKDILEHKFKPVMNKLHSMSTGRKFSSIRELILRELLDKANKEKIQSTSLIYSYIEKKDYESVMLTLEAEKDVKGLSLLYEYLLVIAHDYLEIKTTEKVPPIPNFGINNTFNAISHRHYKRALELLMNHNKAKSIPDNKNILYFALVDINELIESLTLTTIDKDEQVVLTGFEKEKMEIEECEQLEIDGFNEKEVTYADVVSSLIGKKKEEVEDILSKYLAQKGLNNYKYIIDLLLDICTLENDLSYAKAMIELANIGIPKYKLDLSNYIKGFYLSLSGSLFEIAEKYLEIISYANEMVTNKIDVDTLKIALEDKKLPKEETVKVEQPTKVKVTSTDLPRTPKVEKTLVNKEDKDSEQQFIQSKISAFESGEDVVILKAMDNERRKNIHHIVASIPSVKSFSIGNGLSRRIVLTNSPYIEGKINKRALSIEGDKAYREQDYEKCIECYRTLLYLVKPSANVYAKLGLAYMKKNQLEKAIKYLTISTELSKEVDGTFDFTELIAKLSGKGFDAEETKPKFHMDESEFLSEENYYGVEHIEDISRMVFGENISLEEACKTFNYDENQMNVIRLIYAEEYYRAGDYKSGDALVKVVTNAKDKSKRVKKILEQVNARKKFYKNSPRENSLVYMYK